MRDNIFKPFYPCGNKKTTCHTALYVALSLTFTSPNHREESVSLLCKLLLGVCLPPLKKQFLHWYSRICASNSYCALEIHAAWPHEPQFGGKKPRSLRVEASLKPFHNEVREMLCAACAVCECVCESNASRQVYFMFEPITRTKALGGLQAATAYM